MNYFKISRFFLYLVPFAVIVVSISTLFPFIVGKYVWFRTAVDLSLFFFLLGLLLRPEAREYKNRLRECFKSPIAIVLSIFTAVFVVASLFGFDAGLAFWSNFERGEGGFQILHLYLFFVLLGVLFREEKDWRKIFWLSIIAGFFMIFYGIGAGLKYVDAEIVEQSGASGGLAWSGKGGILFQIFRDFIGPGFKEPSFRFQGSIGNPAYVATYIIFMFFYAAYLFLSDKSRRLFSRKNILLAIFSAIFLVFFVFAGTRGAFVGLLASIFLSVVYLAIIAEKWRKKLFVFIICVATLVALVMIFKENPLVKGSPALRIFNISFSARTFQDRTFIWQTALEGFKERPILGWGAENFSQVFDRHFPKKLFRPLEGFGAWFDRAHNVFFDHLVEAGALGLLAYVSIFLVLYLQLFKQGLMVRKKIVVDDGKYSKNQQQVVFSGRENLTKAIFFALPIAYLVQGLVLFEVLVIYLNIFLFFAFMNYKLRQGLFSSQIDKK